MMLRRAYHPCLRPLESVCSISEGKQSVRMKNERIFVDKHVCFSPCDRERSQGCRVVVMLLRTGKHSENENERVFVDETCLFSNMRSRAIARLPSRSYVVPGGQLELLMGARAVEKSMLDDAQKGKEIDWCE